MTMALSTDLQLQADLAWCESVIRIHSGSFYRAFKQLPAKKAQAVFAVYAFCRLADDSIDVDHDPAELNELAAQLEQFASGRLPDLPLWRALRWAFDTFSLDIEPFFAMIRGQRQDVDFHQPQTRQELLDYCYLVAGTVGLMILPLLCEKPSQQVRQTAIDLGIAMQLTNILRDLGDDYRRGRIYLPQDELAKRQIAVTDLGKQTPTPALRLYWHELAQETISRYRLVEQNLLQFDPRARLPISLSLEYYSHITLLGIKRPELILQQRMVVSDFYKLLLLIKSRFRVFFMHRQLGG